MNLSDAKISFWLIYKVLQKRGETVLIGLELAFPNGWVANLLKEEVD